MSKRREPAGTPVAIKEAGIESGEFFYMKDGKRCDAALHEEMLAIGVDTASLERHVAHAVSIGVPEASARKLYGLPEIK